MGKTGPEARRSRTPTTRAGRRSSPGGTGRRRSHEDPPAHEVSLAARIGALVLWWVVLMALWVWVDDSIALPELLVGAVAAAGGALFAQLVRDQAGSRIRVRAGWLLSARSLPLQVLRDMRVVFGALARMLLWGEEPQSALEEVPVRSGGMGAATTTRRVLMVMGASLAPNTLALGIDGDRGVMIVHRLVSARVKTRRPRPDAR